MCYSCSTSPSYWQSPRSQTEQTWKMIQVVVQRVMKAVIQQQAKPTGPRLLTSPTAERARNTHKCSQLGALPWALIFLCTVPELVPYSVRLTHQAVHLHRLHNIDLFCRGAYYIRTSLLLPAKAAKGNDPIKGDQASKGGGGNNRAGAAGEGAAEQVESQGIPYMCLAQCENMETTVGHRRVPPFKVRFEMPRSGFTLPLLT